MKQYLGLVKEIVELAEKQQAASAPDNKNVVSFVRPDRTGVGTYSVFGRQLRFNLEDGYLKSRALYEFERMNRIWLADKVLENLNRRGKKTDEEILELERQHRRIEEMKEKLSEEDELNYYSMLDFFDASVEHYEKAKGRFFSFVENFIALASALITFLMVQEMSASNMAAAASASAAFFISKHLVKQQLKMTKQADKALENFKDRRRKRKRSHKSRRSKRR